jgi:outer membrane protein
MLSKPKRQWLMVAWTTLLAVSTPSLANTPWAASVGAGVIYAPDYLGSDDYETRVWPTLNVSYGDLFYFNIRDGLGWNLIRHGNWRLSPFIAYTPGRDNDGDLRRLDKVDGGATAGLRIAYTDRAWSYSAGIQSPFTGDVDGYQLALKTRWRNQLSDQWIASLGANVTYSSDDWTEDMFGISDAESARSGLAPYSPDDYIRFGVSGSLTYSLSAHWAVTAMAGVTQLTSDAKDSPIVSDIGDATQAYTGLFLSYRF